MNIRGQTRAGGAVLPQGYLPEREVSRQENRVVIRAVNPTGRSAIVKCLRPPFDQSDAADFRHEFLLLDALAHPYWTRPRRFGRTPEGGLFIEMEEAPGITLAAHPIRGWRPDTLETARRILSALASLHRLGVAQLDLKPEQILIHLDEEWPEWNPEGMAAPALRMQVRVLDLGLAAPFHTPLKARGTPGFMAPELLRGETDWDSRADLYALGAVLFDLFTGRPAFEGEDAAGILARQLSGDIPDPAAAADLPPMISGLLRELLSLDPAGRPQSALEVWQRLREQAPRDRVRDIPLRLTGPDTFPFLGREEEIARFRGFLAGQGHVGEPLLVRIQGEMGTGRRRLAARLAAVAQTLGWDSGADDRPIRLHDSSGAGTLHIDVRGERPGAGGDERLLELDLGPMSRTTCDSMLQARGLESGEMRSRLAEECCGNPGLLFTLCASLPEELEAIVPLVGAEALERHLAEADPPEYWLDWCRSRLQGLDRREGDDLILQALQRQARSGTVSPTLVLDRALLRADEERTRSIGSGLLEEGAGETAADRAWVAEILRDREALAEWLGPALEELLDAERFEPALRLLSRSVSILPPDSPGWREAGLIRLAGTASFLGARTGMLLPPPQDLDGLAAGSGLSVWLLFQAWSALARNDWDRADACLSRPEADEAEPFLAGWLRFRRYRFSRDLDKAEQALVAAGEARAGDPTAQFLVQSGRAELLRHQGRMDEAAALVLPLLEEPVPVSEPQRFGTVLLAAGVVLNQGDLDRARELLVQALSLDGETEPGFTRSAALLGLSGLEYQAGNLSRSLEWSEGLIRAWARVYRWDQALTSISNVGLLLLEQGRLGDAWNVLSTGRSLAADHGNHLSRNRIEKRTIQALTWLGIHDRAEDAAARLLEDSRLSQGDRGQVLVFRGESLADQGRVHDSRQAFRESVRLFLDAGMREDAADALGVWALFELDGGDVTVAWAMRSEAEVLMPEVSGLTGSLRALVDGRLAVQAGERPERCLPLLDEAVEILRRQERWIYAWQAHWFRARVHVRMEEPARAAVDYGEARGILSSAVDSIGVEAWVARFLDRMAPRQFLEELESA